VRIRKRRLANDVVISAPMGVRSFPSLAASSAETAAKAVLVAIELRQSAASVCFIMIIIAPFGFIYIYNHEGGQVSQIKTSTDFDRQMKNQVF